MVQLIFGAKGTGKTKKMIQKANDIKGFAKGDVIYITDTDRYRFDLDKRIKYININEFQINTEIGLLGYIKGLISGNYDIQHMFIDGPHRIVENRKIEEFYEFFIELEELAEKYNIEFVLTLSGEEKDLPKFLKKYI